MTERRQWFIVAGLSMVYLAGLGALAGITSERSRFDDVRSKIVHRFEVARERLGAKAMAGERERQSAEDAVSMRDWRPKTASPIIPTP